MKTSYRALPTLAALTLTMSLAAFGCTTNKYPGNGEPATSPMGSPTSTPGTSSGATPTSMTSSSNVGAETSVDAIAILEADAAYRGKILGPAASATTSQAQADPTAQAPTGQFQSPAAYANPQLTTNSSVSSAPVPVITSGAGTGVSVAGVPVTTTGVTASAVTNATVLSTPVTHLNGVANGVVVSPATTSGSTIALPSVAMAPVPATAPAARPLRTPTLPATAATSTVPIQIGTAPAGGVVVTNQPPSLARRFLNAIGIRRAATSTVPATTP